MNIVRPNLKHTLTAFAAVLAFGFTNSPADATTVVDAPSISLQGPQDPAKKKAAEEADAVLPVSGSSSAAPSVSSPASSGNSASAPGGANRLGAAPGASVAGTPTATVPVDTTNPRVRVTGVRPARPISQFIP